MCYDLSVTGNSDSRESMATSYFHSARRHTQKCIMVVGTSTQDCHLRNGELS